MASICCCSVTQSCLTSCNPRDFTACQSSLYFAISWILVTFMSIELMILSNHLILCCLLSFCLQSFTLSGFFFSPVHQLFTLCGQIIGPSDSASVLLMNIQGGYPLWLTDLISLQSKELSRIFSSTTIQKRQFFDAHPSSWSNSYLYMTTGKTKALTMWTLVGKVISLFFVTCSTSLS